MPDAFPLSQTQLDMYVEQSLEPDTPLLNMGVCFQIEGLVDAQALGQAVRHLVMAHEMLRVVMHRTSDLPAQKVGEAVESPLRVMPASNLEEALEQAHDECNAPFRLYEEPLARFIHYPVSGESSLFCIVLHHLIGDGESTLLCVQQLGEIYSELLSGREPVRSAIRPFRVHVQEESRYLKSEAYRQDEAFWAQSLAGESSTHPTSLIRRQDAVYVSEGTLSLEVTARLAALAHSSGGTVFHGALAAFCAFLGEMRRVQTITVGVAVGNRESPTLAGAVGPFAHVIPIRTRWSARDSFHDLLGRTASLMWSGWEHRRCPASALGRASGALRAGHRGVFDVALSWLSQPRLGGTRFGASSISHIRIIQNTHGRFPVELWIADLDRGRSLQLVLKAQANWVPAQLATSLASEFAKFLERLVDKPNEPLGDTLEFSAMALPLDAAAPTVSADLSLSGSLAIDGKQVEQRIAAQCAAVLGLEHLDVNVNFFDAGATSLSLVRIQSRLLETLGIELPLIELLVYPTVAILAARLLSAQDTGHVLDGLAGETRRRLSQSRLHRTRLPLHEQGNSSEH